MCDLPFADWNKEDSKKLATSIMCYFMHPNEFPVPAEISLIVIEGEELVMNVY